MTKTMRDTTVITLLVISAMLTGCHATGGEGGLPALGALPEDAAEVQPLAVGDRAPAAVLRDADNRRVNLAEVYRQKPTLLVFYRGGWCRFCTGHFNDLAEAESDLRDLGFQLIAISPDRPANLRESLDEHDIPYRLLSDRDVELTRAFGIAFRVDEQTYAMLQGFDIDIEDAAGRKHRVLPVPSVYLVDTDGVIRFAHWDPDYRERLSSEAILNAARSVRRE